MKSRLLVIVLFVAAVAVLAGAPFVGMEPIDPRTLWRGAADPARLDILWQIRIPRVLLAFLAGSALAVSGAAFQAMFRNPLAEPFTLGVSSGAALGASVCLHLGWQFSALGVSATSLSALAGSLAAILLVYGLTRVRRGFSVGTMLLAGVAVSFFFSSMILFLQYLSDLTRTFRMLRWVMGGMETVVGFSDLLAVLPFAVSGMLIVLYLTHDLNQLATGEELASSRGVDVNRAKLLVFFATSMMVGAVVAACGPIGFVGLMVPHICRLLVGPDHRLLLPASLAAGGTFLTLCDTVARTVIAPSELPVGIITALLGGPFFLALLLGRVPQEDGR
jgi:iron complex transport system permease protein